MGNWNNEDEELRIVHNCASILGWNEALDLFVNAWYVGQEEVDFILRFTLHSQNVNGYVKYPHCAMNIMQHSVSSEKTVTQSRNGFAAGASVCSAQLSSLVRAANTETAVHTALVNYWGTDTCQLARPEDAPSEQSISRGWIVWANVFLSYPCSVVCTITIVRQLCFIRGLVTTPLITPEVVLVKTILQSHCSNTKSKSHYVHKYTR